MNAKTLLAIAAAVALLFAGLGAAGAVSADETPVQPTDDELPDDADADRDRDRDGGQENESERDRAREHVNDTAEERWNESAEERWNESAEERWNESDHPADCPCVDGDYGPHHADDGHGPHHADENASVADDRRGFMGPMWGVPDQVPDHVTRMHERMNSWFDGDREHPFFEGDGPWSGDDHPRNDSDDHPRNDSDDHRGHHGQR
ncbi:MAG: hypothetical protein V5A46_00750 [Haloferacaceae archaeon]